MAIVKRSPPYPSAFHPPRVHSARDDVDAASAPACSAASTSAASSSMPPAITRLRHAPAEPGNGARGQPGHHLNERRLAAFRHAHPRRQRRRIHHEDAQHGQKPFFRRRAQQRRARGEHARWPHRARQPAHARRIMGKPFHQIHMHKRQLARIQRRPEPFPEATQDRRPAGKPPPRGFQARRQAVPRRARPQSQARRAAPQGFPALAFLPVYPVRAAVRLCAPFARPPYPRRYSPLP